MPWMHRPCGSEGWEGHPPRPLWPWFTAQPAPSPMLLTPRCPARGLLHCTASPPALASVMGSETAWKRLCQSRKPLYQNQKETGFKRFIAMTWCLPWGIGKAVPEPAGQAGRKGRPSWVRATLPSLGRVSSSGQPRLCSEGPSRPGHWG